MAQNVRTCWHYQFKIAEAAEKHEHSHSNLVKLKTFLGPSWETLFCFTRREGNQLLRGQFHLEILLFYSSSNCHRRRVDTTQRHPLKMRRFGVQVLFLRGLPLGRPINKPLIRNCTPENENRLQASWVRSSSATYLGQGNSFICVFSSVKWG